MDAVGSGEGVWTGSEGSVGFGVGVLEGLASCLVGDGEGDVFPDGIVRSMLETSRWPRSATNCSQYKVMHPIFSHGMLSLRGTDNCEQMDNIIWRVLDIRHEAIKAAAKWIVPLFLVQMKASIRQK